MLKICEKTLGREYQRMVAIAVAETKEAKSRRCQARPLSARSTIKSAGAYSAFPETCREKSTPISSDLIKNMSVMENN